MSKFTITNQRIYKEIAKEAYQKMLQASEASRRPNPNGNGEIITYDPRQISFKNSFICIVFTAMWLEALLHTKIVENFNLEKFNELDRKTYEEKLDCLDIKDEALITRVTEFRKSRKEIIHEKSCLGIDIFVTAQDEAKKAFQLMEDISKKLS